MRLRRLTVVGLGVAALGLTSLTPSTAGTPSALGAPSLASVQPVVGGVEQAPERKKRKCYNQLTSQIDAGESVPSQDVYDAGVVLGAADDFVCKGHTGTFRLTKVNFVGLYFNGSGPADSFNLRVWYDNGAGAPISEPRDDIAPVCEYLGLAYTGMTAGSGPQNGQIKIGAGEPKCKVLKGVRYWLEIQAVMALADGGQFSWELGKIPTVGSIPDWRNPDDALGSGCTTYDNDRDLLSCVSKDGNFLFKIT